MLQAEGSNRTFQDVTIPDDSVNRRETFCCPDRRQDISGCSFLDIFLSPVSLIGVAWIGYLYSIFNFTGGARNTKCVSNPIRSTASISSKVDGDFPFPPVTFFAPNSK